MKTNILSILSILILTVISITTPAAAWSGSGSGNLDLSEVQAVEDSFDASIASAIQAGDGVQLQALLASREQAVKVAKERAASKAAALAKAKAEAEAAADKADPKAAATATSSNRLMAWLGLNQ
jgi:hypothetical protein